RRVRGGRGVFREPDGVVAAVVEPAHGVRGAGGGGDAGGQPDQRSPALPFAGGDEPAVHHRLRVAAAGGPDAGAGDGQERQRREPVALPRPAELGDELPAQRAGEVGDGGGDRVVVRPPAGRDAPADFRPPAADAAAGRGV